MCRYGFKIYKSHFACFNCRKSFKKPAIEDYLSNKGQLQLYRQLSWLQHRSEQLTKLEAELDILLDTLRSDYFEQVGKCPQCGGRMADLGRDFKPPRTTDVKAKIKSVITTQLLS